MRPDPMPTGAPGNGAAHETLASHARSRGPRRGGAREWRFPSRPGAAHSQALVPLLLSAFLALLPGCRKTESPSQTLASAAGSSRVATAVPGAASPVVLDPCAVALAPGSAGVAPDPEVASLQDQARGAADPLPALERLGWAYVQKARLTYDPGFYDLAEQAALCIESTHPDAPQALLLRGHVLHNLHRFKEGEPLARRLVALRGEAFDWGLLGDLLMEQGKLDEAVPAYQKMVDSKPGLQAYSRAAHVRWLKGDLPGAIDLMRMAAQAGSPHTGEPVAWAYSRLALYQLQAGNEPEARAACEAALAIVPDYAPALLARGHLLLARGRASEALAPLRQAASENPLPEYQWALAEALRMSGDTTQAASVEQRLMERGAVEDPRTFALFLATRGLEPETALRLAREELQRRADVLTQDALAWSLAAAGQPREAREPMRRALAEGTQDARLFYHAGVIAGMVGDRIEARRWLSKAAAIRQMLLPAERAQLDRQLASL